MLQDVLGSIVACLVSIINSSMHSGCVPAYFKHAVVQPLLEKKTNLDPSLPQNEKPISQLTLIERFLPNSSLPS